MQIQKKKIQKFGAATSEDGCFLYCDSAILGEHVMRTSVGSVAMPVFAECKYLRSNTQSHNFDTIHKKY
jgi:hypothetical protein